MERSWVTLTVLLTLALGCAARHCPLLHAAEGANKTGCYIVVLHKETSPEKFTEIVQRATSMAEGHKLHGLVKNVTKAFTVKLSAYSLNLVGTYSKANWFNEKLMCFHSFVKCQRLSTLRKKQWLKQFRPLYHTI